MWAALTAVHRHNRSEPRKIDSLACPGLGTGTGGMDSVEAALQLFLAYEHYRRPPQFLNPSVAQQRRERIHYGGRWGLNARERPSSDEAPVERPINSPHPVTSSDTPACLRENPECARRGFAEVRCESGPYWPADWRVDERERSSPINASRRL